MGSGEVRKLDPWGVEIQRAHTEVPKHLCPVPRNWTRNGAGEW